MRHFKIQLSVVAAVAGMVAASAVLAPGAEARPAAPVVAGLSDHAGWTLGGSQITVTGANFVQVTAVTFGGVRGSAVKVLSPGRLVVTSPAHRAGVVDVVVSTRSGRSRAVRADRFGYRVPGRWRAPVLALPQTGYLSSVSCPTTSFCAAVDVSGDAILGDGTNWSSPTLIDPPRVGDSGNSGLGAVSCTSANFCMAIDQYGSAFRWNGASWSSSQIVSYSTLNPAFAQSVSCASPAFCVAAFSEAFTGNPSVWSYDGATWTRDFGAVTALFGSLSVPVVCTSSTFCLLSTSDGVFKFDGLAWSNVSPTGSQQSYAVACSAGPNCLVIDAAGNAFTTTGGGWTPAPTAPAGIRAIACSSSTACVASDGTSGWTYDGSTWQSLTGIGSPGITSLQQAFCSPTRCGVADSASVAWLSGSALSSATLIDPLRGGISAAACVSASFCLVAGEGGSVARYNGVGWAKGVTGLTGMVRGISCVSASFCVAVDSDGKAARFNGHGWSRFPQVSAASAGGGFSGISCATTTMCMATNADGSVWRYTSGRWTRRVVHAHGSLGAVSCAPASSCLIGDNNKIVTYSKGVWSRPVAVMPSGHAITRIVCAATTPCLATDGGGLVARRSARGWSRPTQLFSSRYGFDLSCAGSYCLAINTGWVGPSDAESNGIFWFNGVSWTRMQPFDILPSVVACASVRFCLAGDADGYVDLYR